MRLLVNRGLVLGVFVLALFPFLSNVAGAEKQPKSLKTVLKSAIGKAVNPFVKKPEGKATLGSSNPKAFDAGVKVSEAKAKQSVLLKKYADKADLKKNPNQGSRYKKEMKKLEKRVQRADANVKRAQVRLNRIK